MVPAKLSDIQNAVGVNWFGMDVGGRGPTPAELATMVGKGVNFLRLIVAWDTPADSIKAILAAAQVTGPFIGIETHSYGMYPDKTPITPDNVSKWQEKCVSDMRIYGAYTSYVPLDMNEPSQKGADWEKISAARVSALRSAGYTGVIGVSVAQASPAAGVNTIHPNGWWINDNNSFLEAHHYLNGLINRNGYNGDTRENTNYFTRPALDTWASQQGQNVTNYLDYVKKSFRWGLLGSLTSKRADGSLKWPMPVLIGEFAMMPEGFDDVLAYQWQSYKECNVGALQWASGPWNRGYPWEVTENQWRALRRAALAR